MFKHTYGYIFDEKAEMIVRRGYRVTIHHEGLNKNRVVTGRTLFELNRKVNAQKAAWDEQWARKQVQEAKRAARERDMEARRIAKILQERSIAEAQELAEARTKEAEKAFDDIGSLLLESLRKKELQFEDLRDRSTFNEQPPIEGEYKPIPPEPSFNDIAYHPTIPFLVSISSKRRNEFEAANRAKYEADHEAWVEAVHSIEMQNSSLRSFYLKSLNEWGERRKAFEEQQANVNAEVDDYEEQFRRGDSNAVESFYKLALESIEVPVGYEREAYVGYGRDARNLVIDYYLPVLDDFPTLKSVTYVKSRNEFKEKHQTVAFMKRSYEGLVYQLVLRVIKCVSTINDSYDNVDSVVINGRVRSINPATGNEVDSCILSVSTELAAFHELNLNSADPKAWFKSVHGVSAAAISNVTPVAPLVSLNREDKRFVDGYEVIEKLDEGVNVAAMDWQDFENLIRELFEEEFSSTGGEVKITQASRDGGVDAVAFDPDPLRGGKIVIQAKRYTNTVGVSAVRDLYGTVMNEGAIKGILVTTSGFGNIYRHCGGKGQVGYLEA